MFVKFIVKKFMVEKSGVEKSGVEMSFNLLNRKMNKTLDSGFGP